MTYAAITSIGSYLPSRVVTNDDIAATVDTSDTWIRERTGIIQRHFAADGEMTSDLAAHAAREAMERRGLGPSDIDLLIVATITPDDTMPSCAARVQAKLGLTNAAAFDINAACSGFVFGLNTANAFIRSGHYKRVLLVGADTFSRLLDFSDRNTCILFGDGAGAVILEATETKQGILACSMYTNGAYADILNTTGGVSRTQTSGVVAMQGKDVFKHAVAKMSAAITDGLAHCGLTLADVSYVIPHQANQRIMQSIVEKFELPPEKLISTVSQHANTSAASIPLALYDAEKQGKFKKGDILAITALGAGLTWGSCIILW